MEYYRLLQELIERLQWLQKNLDGKEAALEALSECVLYEKRIKEL